MDSAAPIRLESPRLSVEVAQPGAAYKRTRFDWTGFITQITLDDKHTFCSVEDPDPAKGSGGIGLCGEFGIEKAIGYADSQPGEAFPKLGIGLLKRPEEENYRFFGPHEIDQLFPIEVTSTSNLARFRVEPLDCRGYAVCQTKTVSVEENWLTIAYELENRGSRSIHTHEYCHNFIAVDGQTVGPDYQLHFPYTVSIRPNYESFRGYLPPLLRRIIPGFVLKMMVQQMVASSVIEPRGNEIGWKAVPTGAFFCHPLGFFKTDQAQWELTHIPSGVQVREYDDFSPARVALWGTQHVVSPEVYIDIDLEPGQRQTWSRCYEFVG